MKRTRLAGPALITGAVALITTVGTLSQDALGKGKSAKAIWKDVEKGWNKKIAHPLSTYPTIWNCDGATKIQVCVYNNYDYWEAVPASIEVLAYEEYGTFACSTNNGCRVRVTKGDVNCSSTSNEGDVLLQSKDLTSWRASVASRTATVSSVARAPMKRSSSSRSRGRASSGAGVRLLGAER